MNAKAGYREIEHTADWQLEAWAPDLAGLLEQCARGMLALSGARLDRRSAPLVLDLELRAADPEGLLVSFLGELLYLAERDGLALDSCELRLEGLALYARLQALPLLGLDKEIKAVTYHDLSIVSGPDGWRTRVVFDV